MILGEKAYIVKKMAGAYELFVGWNDSYGNRLWNVYR